VTTQLRQVKVFLYDVIGLLRFHLSKLLLSTAGPL